MVVVDLYLTYAPEDKTYNYVVQEHWRGKSVHADLRMESVEPDWLFGFTLDNQIKGVIKDPVTNLMEARDIFNKKDYSKINWKTGEWKQRKKSGQEKLVNVEILCQKKEPIPHDWLTYEGKTGKPKGEETHGATVNYPGVYNIVDKGTIEFGMKKTYAHEFFFHGKGLNYKVVIRLIKLSPSKSKDEVIGEYIELLSNSPLLYEGNSDLLKQALPASEVESTTQEFFWLAIKPIDQTPYVLTKGAVQKKWLPPVDITALPKKVRPIVPKDLEYWHKEEIEKRLEKRKKLVELISKGKIVLNKSLKDFVFSQYNFKGQFVIRFGGKTFWHIFIDTDKNFLLDLKLLSNPLKNSENNCILKRETDKGVMNVEGFIPPGSSKVNPTKDTELIIDILDKGKVDILINEKEFKKFKFSGNNLTGKFDLKRTSKDSDLWVFKESVE